MNFKILRKKYPKFIYEKYSYKISKNKLEIFFDFQIKPDIFLKPKIIIKNIKKSQINEIGERALNNLIFHLGLMEIPSYWKTTCSKEIEIKAGFLNLEQIKWWKNLIIKGMGEFFYQNKINFNKKNFLKINNFSNFISKKNFKDLFSKKLKNKTLVPIGGGKDSIVTLEKLKKTKKEHNFLNVFLVNPNQATKKVIKVAKIKNPIIVKRIIDPILLKLNQKGYLNGHTPFTALLSFLSVFCAILFDYKNIAFSNEKSANEGNVKYLGKTINHQWSKSSEFEKNFKWYLKKYLAKNINYFSFLRPYNELEISKMFLKYPQYFSVFLSCNKGKKIGEERWCGNCPKCLFVYALFYPYLEKEKLFKIFKKDIFENKKLLSIMKGLLEEKKVKPFECVGTKKENKIAFDLSLKKAKKIGKIPYLLTKL